MNNNVKPLHEQIASRLIIELEAGTSPFQRPWTDQHAPAFTIPLNPSTNKNYRGLNALWLAMQGYTDPRWMTLKQAAFAGCSVLKGAKATMINFVKKTGIEAIRDEQGHKILDSEGKTQTRTRAYDKPIITHAWVFNAAQISGLIPLPEYLQLAQAQRSWQPVERAEQLLASSKAMIRHGGNEAYYNKTFDEIHLPEKGQFESQTSYYAVALHELGHWTGHQSRLDRPMDGRFGSDIYAREELRAEIASLMLGSELGIGHSFGQHAAYVACWVRMLSDEPYELFRASSDAQKIVDYVLGFEPKPEQSPQIQSDQQGNGGSQIACRSGSATAPDTDGTHGSAGISQEHSPEDPGGACCPVQAISSPENQSMNSGRSEGIHQKQP